MSTFKLPDLGEGLQEAEIVDWHVSEGDHVVADQPIVSVETEKAVVEIPSPQSGLVSKLFGQTGDVIAVGSPLVQYGDGEVVKSESVVGQLPREEAPARKMGSKANKVKAAPAVRQLAAALGIDLEKVVGSGPLGSITEGDLKSFGGNDAVDSKRQKLSGPRRAMARTMADAGAAIVPASVTADADVGVWFGRDEPMVRLLLGMIAGCRAEPALNTWFDRQTESRTVHQHINIGVAVDTKDGLFVPVLRNAEGLDADGLLAGVNSLKQQVIDRTIERTMLKNPTITLSNFGSLIGRYANLVVVPPQVAILGGGKISDQVLSIDQQPVVRPVLPLSLTFDHRVVTGGEAARFLRAVIDSLESKSGTSP